MKEWIKADMKELDLRCTEYGKSKTKFIDAERVDENGDLWFSSQSGPIGEV